MPATKRFFYFILKAAGILPGRDYTALRLVTAQVLADKSVTTKRFFYFISKAAGILPGRDYTAFRLVTAQVLADKSVTTKSHQTFTQERQNTNSTAAYE